jgi:HD-GYP domain-containing protein (c-di-GMP phosphodiesterase class II)
MAGLLHDIGKIGVPDYVLGKPDRLTDEEFAQIKRHPEIGCAILKHLKQLHFVLPGVLHHHESFDGRGYPHGLAGDSIPLLGRIIAVADAYDAMTSDRPYRSGMPTEKAEAILRSGAGKQWDPRMIEAFFQEIDEAHQICGVDHSRGEALLDGQHADSNRGADEIAQAIGSILT